MGSCKLKHWCSGSCCRQCIKWHGCVLVRVVCLQEGQQYGEGGDQSVPGEQEDLSGSRGTSYRWVMYTQHIMEQRYSFEMFFCCNNTVMHRWKAKMLHSFVDSYNHLLSFHSNSDDSNQQSRSLLSWISFYQSITSIYSYREPRRLTSWKDVVNF